MKKVRIALAGAVALATFALPSSIAWGATNHATYALGHAKHCKVGFVKQTLRHKVHGKSLKYIACVYAPVKKSGRALASSSTTTGTARASIDPTYTQDPDNPLKVTFIYFAGVADGPLPNGVLALHWGPTRQSKTLACSDNVGVKHGTSADPLLCTITFAAYGTEYVTTTYTSGTDSATQTDREDIQNPNKTPIPVIVTGPASTSTLITSSYFPASPSVGTLQIGASVYGGEGQGPSLSSGDVTFTFYDGSTPVGTYTGLASAPASCTFYMQTLGYRVAITTTSPNYCTGPDGGTIVLTDDVASGQLSVRATYGGNSAWAASSSTVTVRTS